MNVIQVGVGKMGQHWLDVLWKSDDVDLVGVVEPVDQLRDAAIEKVGLSPDRGFRSLDDALATIEFDAAVVVTPPPSHRPIAGQLLEAGKHVLMEKPLATTIEDARELVDIADRTDRVLMVGQNYRYFNAFATVRDLVGRGEVGTVSAVNIQFHKDARTMFGYGDFRYSMEHVLLVDMSIHHFDLIRAALGVNASRVYAQTWHVPDGNFQYDAAASVLITMETGATVTYTGNWATYSSETSWNGDWEIVGEKGRISWTGGDWNHSDITLQHWGGEPVAVDMVQLERGGQNGLLHDFVTALATGAQPDTAAASNIDSLAIVFAAIESAETGRAIELE
jgi:predicted dehydrogenase